MVGACDFASAPGTRRDSNSAGAPDFVPFAHGFGSTPAAGSWGGSA
jgi:hypothetical protein